MVCWKENDLVVLMVDLMGALKDQKKDYDLDTRMAALKD
jgi:hypothetical protein